MTATTAKQTPIAQNTRQQLDELDALLQKMLALPVNPNDPDPGEDAEPEPAPISVPRRTENTVLPKRVSLRPMPQQPAEKTPPTPPVAEEPVSVLGPRLVRQEEALPVREVATPEEQPAEDWVPLRGDWQPSAQTWGPLAEIFKHQGQQEQTAAATATELPLTPGEIRETIVIPVVPPDAANLPHLPTPVPEVPTSSAEAMARLHATRRATPEAAVPPPARPAAPRRLALVPVVILNGVYDIATYPLGPLGRWLRGPSGRGLLAFLGGIFLTAASILLALDWCEWTW